MIRRASMLALLLSACGQGEGDVSTPNGTGAELLRSRLVPLLAPGAVELSGYSVATVAKLSLRTTHAPPFGTVGQLSGVGPARTSTDSTTTFLVTPLGGTLPLDRARHASVLNATAPPFVAGAALWLGTSWVHLGTRHARPLGGAPVAGTLGRGASEEYIATLTSTGNAVLGAATAIEGPHALDSRALLSRTFAAPAYTRWVDEAAPNVLAAVVQDASGVVTYARTDGSADRTTSSLPLALDTSGQGYDRPVPDRIQRGADGDLLFSLDDADAGPGGLIVRWRVDGDGTTAEVARAAPIAGFRWLAATAFGDAIAVRDVPNEDEPSLSRPLEYRFRRWNGAAFDVGGAPLTPCADDERCRSQGESYLLGVVGAAGHEVAVYAVWSWKRSIADGTSDLVSVIARPLDPAAPSVVAACEDGASSCASTTERVSCAGGVATPSACENGCLLGLCGASCTKNEDCHQASGPCESDVCASGACQLAFRPSGSLCQLAAGVGACDGGGGCQPPACSGCAHITAMDASAKGACLVLETGTATCWGAGLPGPALGGPVYLQSTGLAAEAGGTMSCVLETNGGATCGGANDHGQLALGHKNPVSGWAPLAGGAKVSSLAVGLAHACATQPAGLSCWGSNTEGQVGNGSFGGDVTKLTLVSPSAFTSIAAGAATTCAIAADGVLWCWGDNSAGQALTGSVGGRVVTPTATGITGASAVTLGDRHGCALLATAGANVLCWGDGAKGQAGPAINATSGSPAPVPLDDVKQITAGAAHTCVLSSAGAVSCFGANDRGQLGLGAADAQPHPQPAPVPGITGAVAVSAGGSHTCALLAGGRLACWGENDAGQLGDGSNVDQPSPVLLAR